MLRAMLLVGGFAAAQQHEPAGVVGRTDHCNFVKMQGLLQELTSLDTSHSDHFVEDYQQKRDSILEDPDYETCMGVVARVSDRLRFSESGTRLGQVSCLFCCLAAVLLS
eukprot:COSAG04_NODE_125_length_24621_cov_23.574015_16_plen_109_part_00